jgi:hypothetical protein
LVSRISIALILVVLILGIASGVSLSNIFQQYTNILTVLTTLFAWSGSAIGIYRLFNEYFKEQNKPKLDYSGIYPSGSNCFLKIHMVSGEGMAKNCVGNYTIKNKMENVPTVWEHSERRECDTGPPMGPLLFGIEGDRIVFRSAHGHQPYGSVKNHNPLNEFIEDEIVVNIYTKKGKPPTEPYKGKIKDIKQICNL